MRGALTDGFAAGVFSPAGVSTVADSAGARASTGADSADAEVSTGADSVGDGASDEPVTISFNSNAFARFPSAEISHSGKLRECQDCPLQVRADWQLKW